MVLEALHPDRLGEDLIALSTPSHPHHDADAAALVGDWTLTAPPALPAPDDGQPPVRTPTHNTRVRLRRHPPWMPVARD